jgi:hypothetical protein
MKKTENVNLLILGSRTDPGFMEPGDFSSSYFLGARAAPVYILLFWSIGFDAPVADHNILFNVVMKPGSVLFRKNIILLEFSSLTIVVNLEHFITSKHGFLEV